MRVCNPTDIGKRPRTQYDKNTSAHAWQEGNLQILELKVILRASDKAQNTHTHCRAENKLAHDKFLSTKHVSTFQSWRHTCTWQLSKQKVYMHKSTQQSWRYDSVHMTQLKERMHAIELRSAYWRTQTYTLKSSVTRTCLHWDLSCLIRLPLAQAIVLFRAYQFCTEALRSCCFRHINLTESAAHDSKDETRSKPADDSYLLSLSHQCVCNFLHVDLAAGVVRRRISMIPASFAQLSACITGFFWEEMSKTTPMPNAVSSAGADSIKERTHSQRRALEFRACERCFNNGVLKFSPGMNKECSSKENENPKTLQYMIVDIYATKTYAHTHKIRMSALQDASRLAIRNSVHGPLKIWSEFTQTEWGPKTIRHKLVEAHPVYVNTLMYGSGECGSKHNSFKDQVTWLTWGESVRTKYAVREWAGKNSWDERQKLKTQRKRIKGQSSM